MLFIHKFLYFILNYLINKYFSTLPLQFFVSSSSFVERAQFSDFLYQKVTSPSLLSWIKHV